MTTFSLIIPCFNEADNLPILLERCAPLGDKKNIEIIFVNNGSTDNTEQVLDKILPKYPFCRSIHIQINQGYGFGILQGLNEAKGDVLGWTHADLQTDPNDVLRGLDIFIKSEYKSYVKGIRIKRRFIDLFFSIGMGIFEVCIFQKLMWDINAQPNIFPKSFYKGWNNPPHDYSLDLYAYYMAKNSKLKIHRFPVFFNQRSFGKSHWNTNWLAKVKFIYKTIIYSIELRKRGDK